MAARARSKKKKRNSNHNPAARSDGPRGTSARLQNRRRRTSGAGRDIAPAAIRSTFPSYVVRDHFGGLSRISDARSRELVARGHYRRHGAAATILHVSRSITRVTFLKIASSSVTRRRSRRREIARPSSFLFLFASFARPLARTASSPNVSPSRRSPSRREILRAVRRIETRRRRNENYAGILRATRGASSLRTSNREYREKRRRQARSMLPTGSRGRPRAIWAARDTTADGHEQW